MARAHSTPLGFCSPTLPPNLSSVRLPPRPRCPAPHGLLHASLPALSSTTCPPAATRRVFFKFQAVFLKIPALVQFWLLALGDISSLHCTLQSFPAWCPAHASSPSPLTPAPGLPHDTGSVSVRSTVGHTEARERQACAEGAGQKWQSWAWEAGSGCPIWSTNPSAPLTTGQGRPLGARKLGRGAATISTEGHGPSLGLEWPPAPGGQAAGGLET